jgi:hypothetical protein
MFNDTTEVYRAFQLSNQNNLGLRPGSPVSDISDKSLPSPKGMASNILSLPNFAEEVNRDIAQSKEYFHHSH